MEARSEVPSAAANGKKGQSLISDAKFRQLYELATRLRMTARGDGSGRAHGREAVLAGVAADLRADDGVVAEFAGSMEEWLRGEATLRMNRRSFEERVIEALSDAVGDRMRKTGRVSVIFTEGGQAEKMLAEARAIAGAARLPVLFVEEQRNTRGSARKKPPTAQNKTRGIPPPAAYPTIPVDQLDVIAMYRVAHESLQRARDGSGPTHILAVRWEPAASRGKSRGKGETRDAVRHLEEWLMARGLPVEAWRKEIAAAFGAAGLGRTGPRIETQGEGADEDGTTERRAIA